MFNFDDESVMIISEGYQEILLHNLLPYLRWFRLAELIFMH